MFFINAFYLSIELLFLERHRGSLITAAVRAYKCVTRVLGFEHALTKNITT